MRSVLLVIPDTHGGHPLIGRKEELVVFARLTRGSQLLPGAVIPNQPALLRRGGMGRKYAVLRDGECRGGDRTRKPCLYLGVSLRAGNRGVRNAIEVHPQVLRDRQRLARELKSIKVQSLRQQSSVTREKQVAGRRHRRSSPACYKEMPVSGIERTEKDPGSARVHEPLENSRAEYEVPPIRQVLRPAIHHHCARCLIRLRQLHGRSSRSEEHTSELQPHSFIS